MINNQKKQKLKWLVTKTEEDKINDTKTSRKQFKNQTFKKKQLQIMRIDLL